MISARVGTRRDSGTPAWASGRSSSDGSGPTTSVRPWRCPMQMMTSSAGRAGGQRCTGCSRATRGRTAWSSRPPRRAAATLCSTSAAAWGRPCAGLPCPGRRRPVATPCPAMVDIARRRSRGVEGVWFVVGDAVDLPLTDASVSVVCRSTTGRIARRARRDRPRPAAGAPSADRRAPPATKRGHGPTDEDLAGLVDLLGSVGY